MLNWSNRRFWITVGILGLLALLGLIGLAYPTEGQEPKLPKLTTWERETVLPRFAPTRTNKPDMAYDGDTIAIISQNLTPAGHLHVEFQITNLDPTKVYDIGYLNDQGNFVSTGAIWSDTGTTSFNFPGNVYRIRCSINVNWSAGGYLWLPEWDPDGFFGLSRRFISIDFQNGELSLITNVRSPIGIISDGHTQWLSWYTIDYGVYRAVIPGFTACRFAMPVEGYPIVFLNRPIISEGQNIYRIASNCPTPTPVPTIPAPTPSPVPTTPAPTPTPFRLHIPLLLR